MRQTTWGDGLSAQQRAALAAWALAKGGKLTAADVAKAAGIGLRGAQTMLAKLGEVLPVGRNPQQEWVEWKGEE